MADPFSQITDDGFPGAKALAFIGQRIVYAEPFGRYWGWSSLADGTSWNSLDQAQAETSPDRIQGLIVSHNEVLIFGERTIEPWAHAPTETAVFQLQVGSVIESGCASGKTIVQLDNSVFYLTNNGQIARLNGYTPQVISTAAMEASIRDLNWSRAFAFVWEDAGHVVYYITFPDGYTWGYDVRQGKWHRRASYGLDRWRINALAKSNGKWIAGDYTSGRVYEIEWGNVYEACEIMPRTFRSGVLHNASNRVRVDGFRLVAATGQPPIMPTQATFEELQNYLLVTGNAPDTGEPSFTAAESLLALAFDGLPPASGADINGSIPDFFDGVWGAASVSAVRYSTDDRDTWQTGTVSLTGSIKHFVMGPDGCFASGSGDTLDYAISPPTPTAFTAHTITVDLGSGAQNVNQIGFMRWQVEEELWVCAGGGTGLLGGLLMSSPTLAATAWTPMTGLRPNGILLFHDRMKFGDAVYATVTTDGGRAQLRRSDDGGATFTTILIDTPTSGDLRPYQLQSNGLTLVVVCWGNYYTYTSADNFSAPSITNLGTNRNGVGIAYEVKGRQIRSVGNLYYLISGSNSITAGLANKCVTSLDGVVWSEPVALGITSALGIATDVDPAYVPPFVDTCTPMEGGVFQLRYANDGSENWSDWRDAEPPRTGWFLQPIVFRRLGMARHRVWEVMDTSNRPQDIVAAEIIAASE